MTAAFLYIPKFELPLLRCAAWAAYGYFQGEQMTGIWVRLLCMTNSSVQS